MPLRLPVRLVHAGLAVLVAAAIVLTVIAARPASPDPAATERAGAQAWAMIQNLFHVGFQAPGSGTYGTAPIIAPIPPLPGSPGGSAVALLPPAVPAAPSTRAVPIDRQAAPKPAAPAAPAPAPVAITPPVAAAPMPAPLPLAPTSLLDEVANLLGSLLGLLG